MEEFPFLNSRTHGARAEQAGHGPARAPEFGQQTALPRDLLVSPDWASGKESAARGHLRPIFGLRRARLPQSLATGSLW